MGFYIRKSIRLGPVRLNLSKSGIGTSIGIKGFRIGSGPRGNYIHAGRNGFYYRTSLPSSKSISRSAPALQQEPITSLLPIPDATHGPFQNIESGDVLQMVDASSESLLEELNQKQKLIRFWPFIAALTTAAALLGNSDFLPWTAIAGIIVTIAVYYYDEQRKSVVMFYDFEPEQEAIFQKLHNAFQLMANCRGIWHTEAQASIKDRKYHAGANALVKRNLIRLAFGQPSFVKTNINVPAIPAGKKTLYFFPDRLLIFQENTVGAVNYRDLKIALNQSRFVESGTVPSDAKIVDYTWHYVNKNGGPDKRFRDNRRLPIALYEESHFQSTNGLNEIISFSKCGIVLGFNIAIAGLIANEAFAETQLQPQFQKLESTTSSLYNTNYGMSQNLKNIICWVLIVGDLTYVRTINHHPVYDANISQVSMAQSQPITTNEPINNNVSTSGGSLQQSYESNSSAESQPIDDTGKNSNASIVSSRCYGDGDTIIMQGTASPRSFTLADGSITVAWVLTTTIPVCISSPGAQDSQVSRFQVIGSKPPEGEIIELTGKLSTGNFTQNYTESNAIKVISGRRISNASTAPSLSSNPPGTASFDCQNAKSTLELLICADKELSALDGHVGQLYYQMLMAASNDISRKEMLRDEQREFLKNRIKTCTIPLQPALSEQETQSLIMCLKDVYISRINALEAKQHVE